MQKIALQIEGMTCQSCASRIEKVLNKKPFVHQANVNFASEEAQIEFDDSQASALQLIEIIQKTGFNAHAKTQPKNTALSSIPPRVLLLWLINLPFLLGMLGMLFGSHQLMLPAVWQFVLASIVQFILAIPFYRSAWGSLRGGLANMDVLVSLGTLAIYSYSAAMWLFSTKADGQIYFEASVMVLGFVSLGKFLEERTKKHSLNSLALLIQLTPQQVQVQREGNWRSEPLNQIQQGDLLCAKQGDRIAADGIVVEGAGWCDESHLTGESIPLSKQTGSKVLAGALLHEGYLVYRAEQLGSHTLLGDMMTALSDAQGSKAPIARFADKVAAVFVPTVIALSAVTFILTFFFTQSSPRALMHAVAVLVIACPCALGLATPAAIIVGMGKAFQRGIWFKDAAAMEETAHVDCVVLDKTGTLTKGKPQVVGFWRAPHSQLSESEIYALSAALEQHSNHPLACAIVQAAGRVSLPHHFTVEQIKTRLGEGIEAEIDGLGSVKIGKPSFCQFSSALPTDSTWQLASIVALSINQQPIAAFALADGLKMDSAQAIQRLKQLGIDVIIMSGDNTNAVQLVAQQLEIKQAHANMSPRDKAQAIQRLQQQGHKVAMVGDGVNDAPALALANVSFAMQNGSDIAQHSASATLTQHSLNQLVDALNIAQATLKNIKQNLFFACIYNALGIPLAALGLLNPVIAGAAMALSSISVLGNALRLKNFVAWDKR